MENIGFMISVLVVWLDKCKYQNRSSHMYKIKYGYFGIIKALNKLKFQAFL